MKLNNTNIFRWVLGMMLPLFVSMSALHAQNNCPLPPPSSVWINGVTSSTIDAAWAPVPGAALYRVTLTNLITNQVVVDGTTIGTNKIFTNLTASTPYRVGVSASACEDADLSDFGEPATRDARTLDYIVGDIVMGRCELGSSNLGLPTGGSVITVSIPKNDPNTTSLKYYQAKLSGMVNGTQEEWTCLFSIVVPCSDHFYVDLDTEENGSVNIASPTLGSTSIVEFKHSGGPTLFSLNNPATFGTSAVHTSQISFAQGITVSEFSSNAGGTDCTMTNPGWLCGGKSRSASVASTFASTLAPNPASDRVDLRFQLAAASEVDVNLYDTAGRLVQQAAQQVTLPEGANQLSMDVSTLPPGFYFVQLRTAQGMETLTLVKQ